MSLPRRSGPRSRSGPPARARGVVLIVTLVATMALLVALVAALRTVDTGRLAIDNAAVRRDLVNRAGQAIAAARASLAAGALTTVDDPALHYSSSRLAEDRHGVPAILDDDGGGGYVATYGPETGDATGDRAIALRYVIDRQCNGGAAPFSTAACEFVATAGAPDAAGRGSNVGEHPQGRSLAVYRISVRVAGPRRTLAYVQATYAADPGGGGVRQLNWRQVPLAG